MGILVLSLSFLDHRYLPSQATADERWSVSIDSSGSILINARKPFIF